ncbi:MAG: STAS domain-containing protein [Elusimicrobia bacterium]|nr:STAS domain-containing protein [Elusimicrobiota bacterium]
MDIAVRKAGSAVVVSVSGRIDAVTAPEFESRFAEILGQGDTRFIMELSGLEYISSVGLRAMLSAAKRVGQLPGKLAFIGLQGYPREVFQMAGFLSILTVFPSEAEALAKM